MEEESTHTPLSTHQINHLEVPNDPATDTSHLSAPGQQLDSTIILNIPPQPLNPQILTTLIDSSAAPVDPIQTEFGIQSETNLNRDSPALDSTLDITDANLNQPNMGENLDFTGKILSGLNGIGEIHQSNLNQSISVDTQALTLLTQLNANIQAMVRHQKIVDRRLDILDQSTTGNRPLSHSNPAIVQSPRPNTTTIRPVSAPTLISTGSNANPVITQPLVNSVTSAQTTVPTVFNTSLPIPVVLNASQRPTIPNAPPVSPQHSQHVDFTASTNSNPTETLRQVQLFPETPTATTSTTAQTPFLYTPGARFVDNTSTSALGMDNFYDVPTLPLPPGLKLKDLPKKKDLPMFRPLNGTHEERTQSPLEFLLEFHLSVENSYSNPDLYAYSLKDCVNAVDTTAVRALLVKLRRSDGTIPWDQVRHHFVKLFTNPNDVHCQLQEFNNIKQAEGEDVTNYTARFENLARACGTAITTAHACNIYQAGLSDWVCKQLNVTLTINDKADDLNVWMHAAKAVNPPKTCTAYSTIVKSSKQPAKTDSSATPSSGPSKRPKADSTPAKSSSSPANSKSASTLR